jgi:thioredoxin-dependent peroxiredoxin
MSKKTQKKTVKKASKAVAKPARAASRGSAAKPAAKKKPAKASHQAASKPLKAERPKAAAKRKAALSAAAKSAPKSAHKPAPAKAESPAAAHPSSATAAHGVLAEGTKAPAFQLPRDGGATVSLSDYAGRKLVLFFYPRADTPGCTKEAIDFTRLASSFEESGTAVLGVSADPTKAQEAFRNKHQLSVPLASDEQHAMLAAYGVWGEKSMYGRTFLGITRTTVLIGPDSRIIRIWRNVKVDGHADEVLEVAQNA